MRARKRMYIIGYDICKDKARTRVEKSVKKFGKRVNRSVFECMMTETQYNTLIKILLMYIDEATDKVIIYRICVDCYSTSCQLPLKKRNIQLIKIL